MSDAVMDVDPKVDKSKENDVRHVASLMAALPACVTDLNPMMVGRAEIFRHNHLSGKVTLRFDATDLHVAAFTMAVLWPYGVQVWAGTELGTAKVLSMPSTPFAIEEVTPMLAKAGVVDAPLWDGLLQANPNTLMRSHKVIAAKVCERILAFCGTVTPSKSLASHNKLLQAAAAVRADQQDAKALASLVGLLRRTGGDSLLTYVAFYRQLNRMVALCRRQHSMMSQSLAEEYEVTK